MSVFAQITTDKSPNRVNWHALFNATKTRHFILGRPGVRLRQPRRPHASDGEEAQHRRHHRHRAGRRAHEVHLPRQDRRLLHQGAQGREDLRRGGAEAGLLRGRGGLWKKLLGMPMALRSSLIFLSNVFVQMRFEVR